MQTIYDIYAAYESHTPKSLVLILQTQSNYNLIPCLFEHMDTGELEYIRDLSLDDAITLFDEGLAKWW